MDGPRGSIQNGNGSQNGKDENERLIGLDSPSKTITEELEPSSHWLSWRVLKLFESSFLSFLIKLILVVAISLATGVFKYFKSSLMGDLAAAFKQGDLQGSYYFLTLFAFQYLAEKFTYTLRYFLADAYAYIWRKNLTYYLLEHYLTGNAYYRLNAIDKMIDNPDQRMTEDVANLTQDAAFGFCGIITKAGTSALLIAGFITTITWQGPVTLFGIVVILGLMLAYLGKIKAELIFSQDHYEGDYRYAHIRIRTNAESIAFFSGHQREEEHLGYVFKDVIANWKKIINLNFWIATVSDLGESTVGAAGVMLVLVFTLWPQDGPMDPKQSDDFAKQFTLAYGLATDFFSEFFDIFSYINPLSAAIGNAKRIQQLLEAFDAYEYKPIVDDSMDPENPQQALTPTKYVDAHYVEFRNVSSFLPVSGLPLARNVSFKVQPGENLLIVGPSGCGKSSLLRNLSGIWPIQSGSISRPSNIGFNGLMYMPQQPYLVIGSLKDQILYPDPRSDLSNATLQKYLNLVGLGHLTERASPDALIDWKKELSRGEQQRLVMARLFYHRPMFALLDESTSALDHPWEKKVHQIAAKFNITLISVGHRKSLYNFHSKILKLKTDGSWKIVNSKTVLSKALEFMSEEQKHPDDPVIPERLYHVPALPPNPYVGKTGHAKIDCTFLRRVWRIARMAQPDWFSINSLLLIFIIAMGFIYMGLNLAVAESTERVINSTQVADKGTATLWLAVTIGTLLASSFLVSGSTFFAAYVAWDWRTSLTHCAHGMYLTDSRVYYNMQIDKTIDNPDQRVASDLRSYLVGIGTDNPWARGLVNCYRIAIMSIILIIGYSIYTFISTSFLPPLFLIAYNIIAYVPTHVLLKRLADTIYEKERQEGDFRFLQAHIREHSEAIAFYKANQKTLNQSNAGFKILLQAQWDYAVKKFQLNFVSQSLAVLNDVIGPLSLVLSVEWGLWDTSKMTSSQIFAEYSATAGLLRKTSSALLNFFELMPSLAGLAGSGSRFAEFVETCERLHLEKTTGKGLFTSNYGFLKDGEGIKMERVSASTPEGLRVVENLDLELRSGVGDNLLIMGPSGCGKSSLFRILKGLWPLQHGTITLPSHLGYKGLFFLSQNPYFVSGTLREQIIYPAKGHECLESDLQLQSYLDKVGVGYLTQRHPDGLEQFQLNWENILSGGEQQRLVMCRLLYHKPRFAALDESTSAVDEDMEMMLYKMCHKAGITTFSVGHRDTLIPLHRYLLKIGNKDGSHIFTPTLKEQTIKIDDS